MFGMSRIAREGRSIQRIPRGMQVPMSTTVQPDEVVRNLMSVEAAAVHLAGGIVMGDSPTRFRGACASDLLMSLTRADSLGATTVTRCTVTGSRNPDTATAALAAAGFVNGMDHRVRRTWGPLQGALNESKREGLEELIDLDYTNRFGGCFHARLHRISGDLGYLSRHSRRMAFDMNTATNPRGRAPNLDCRIVRLLRKWGFAWDGNFTPADGVHFEYVGERRHTIVYSSRYYPNVAGNDR
jgi:hypothetical protein